jgi:hypothetical protein
VQQHLKEEFVLRKVKGFTGKIMACLLVAALALVALPMGVMAQDYELVGIFPPADFTMGTGPATLLAVEAALGNTIDIETVEVDDSTVPGSVTSVAVTWTLVGGGLFDDAPGVSNVFEWNVDMTDLDALEILNTAGIDLDGQVTVTNASQYTTTLPTVPSVANGVTVTIAPDSAATNDGEGYANAFVSMDVIIDVTGNFAADGSHLFRVMHGDALLWSVTRTGGAGDDASEDFTETLVVFMPVGGATLTLENVFTPSLPGTLPVTPAVNGLTATADVANPNALPTQTVTVTVSFGDDEAEEDGEHVVYITGTGIDVAPQVFTVAEGETPADRTFTFIMPEGGVTDLVLVHRRNAPISNFPNIVIPAPVAGATPRTTFADPANPSQWTATIAWAGNPSTFEEDGVYEVESVTIVANPGFTLTGAADNFTVNGVDTTLLAGDVLDLTDLPAFPPAPVIVVQTNVSDITLATASMAGFILLAGALWGIVLRNKSRKAE